MRPAAGAGSGLHTTTATLIFIPPFWRPSTDSRGTLSLVSSRMALQITLPQRNIGPFMLLIDEGIVPTSLGSPLGRNVTDIWKWMNMDARTVSAVPCGCPSLIWSGCLKTVSCKNEE